MKDIMVRIILGDVETSGLDEDAGVVEVAWTEIDENLTIKSSFYSRINPGVPINPAASGVHGITDKDVADAPTIHEFVGDRLSEGEVLLVAHNAAFDQRFFKPHFSSLFGTLCTLKMARLIYPDSPNHKLQTLRYFLDLDAGSAHSAAGDVETLYWLIYRMLEDTNMTFEQLWDMSLRPVLIERMPFGKHKDVPLKDLPSGYIRWLLSLADTDDNLRYSLEAL